MKDPFNAVDFIVLVAAFLVFFFATSASGAARSLRAIRALRPLRLIGRNDSMRIIASSLVLSMPALISVSILICSLISDFCLQLLDNVLQHFCFLCSELLDLHSVVCSIRVMMEVHQA